ncbi:MAG: outer membrane protein assembly factor BamA [Treponema sp.]|nr:MAG: outer membrane protein assembly factor BamA [Treponema sp.]
MYKKVKVIFVFLLMTFSVFAQSGDWYKGKPIKKIRFEGNKDDSSTELNAIFAEYKGKLLSDDLYYEILQKLYDLDYFTDIVPKAVPTDESYSGVLLIFVVKEKPRIAGYKFTGNNTIGSGELLKQVLLKKGNIYNEAKAKRDEQLLRDYYILKGYEKSKVSYKTTLDKEKNTLTLEYTIFEGKQTVVKTILFEGGTVFSPKKIKKVLASKEARLLQKGAFQDSNLEKDKEAIKFLYGEKGYVNAYVETVKKDIDTKTDPLKNHVTLTYVIFEGDQYTYSGTNFVGNKIFKTEELQECITLQIGDILNLKKFQLGFSKVADKYYENGYMSTFIDVKKSVDPLTKTAGFSILINEEERSHIENIIIRGNTKTKDKVILREILLKPGDVFSKSKFENSIRNLHNLRYFSSITYDFQPGSERNLVDLIINIEEKATANVGFGITFSGIGDADTFPLSFFLEWNEINLVGTGSELNVGFNAGPKEQSLKLGYTENWFLDTPLSVGFNVSTTHKKLSAYQDVLYPIGVVDPFLSSADFDVATANAHSMKYDRWEIGFGVNTAYTWYPKYAMITLSGGVNFNLVKNVYDKDLFRPYDPVVRNQQKKWGFSNSLWTKASFDGRDIIHDPSKGWFLSQQFTFFGIIPKVESEYFFRSETKGEAYFTLLDKAVSDVWNLKFVLGFYTGFSFQVPLNNKPIGYESQLFIDGRMIGRGWMALGGKGIGNALINHWIEFRMPLAPGILSFDFFFDAAAIKPTINDISKLRINDYYFSFGPGLRFSLPQFPIRLMFANTFRSDEKGKPYWGNGKGADWKFVISFNIPNL